MKNSFEPPMPPEVPDCGVRTPPGVMVLLKVTVPLVFRPPKRWPFNTLNELLAKVEFVP